MEAADESGGGWKFSTRNLWDRFQASYLVLIKILPKMHGKPGGCLGRPGEGPEGVCGERIGILLDLKHCFASKKM